MSDSDSDKSNGKAGRNEEKSDFTKSYDRDEHSDVMLEIKGSYNNGSWDHTSIHAHQCILEAGSAYFHRELRLPKYAGQKIKTVQMDLSFTPEQNEIVVRHLYGFDFMDDWKTEIPTKLHDFLGICAIASRYEISGLRDAALTAADRALSKCLSDKNRNASDDEDGYYDDYADEFADHCTLDTFLGSKWDEMIEDERHIPHFLTILEDHLTKLYFHEFFAYPAGRAPKVIRCLVDELLKEKTHRESVRDLQRKKPRKIHSLFDELVKAKGLKSLLDEEPRVARCLLDELMKERALWEGS